jgi:hypothetical protein
VVFRRQYAVYGRELSSPGAAVLQQWFRGFAADGLFTRIELEPDAGGAQNAAG